MCQVDYLHLGLSLPALRGSQGGRPMYVTLPSNSVINTFFPTHIEGGPDARSGFLDDRKVDRIAGYIEAKPDGFVMGAITYATDSECVFEEALPGAQFGVLRLPLNAKLRSLDGQHRREALRTVVERLAGVATQHTALVLYVEPRLDRRRSMFQDLNRDVSAPNAGPQAETDPVRDPFAVAAADLARSHPFLAGRVKLDKRRGTPRLEAYDLGTLESCLKRLLVGPTGRVKDPTKYGVDEVRERGWALFDGLAAIRSAEGAEPETLRWPVVLKVVAGAAWCLLDPQGEYRLRSEEFDGALHHVDFSPAGEVWRASGLSDGRARSTRQSQGGILAAVRLLTSAVAAEAAASSVAAEPGRNRAQHLVHASG